jgi:hypothetical protein
MTGKDCQVVAYFREEKIMMEKWAEKDSSPKFLDSRSGRRKKNRAAWPGGRLLSSQSRRRFYRSAVVVGARGKMARLGGISCGNGRCRGLKRRLCLTFTPVRVGLASAC